MFVFGLGQSPLAGPSHLESPLLAPFNLIRSRSGDHHRAFLQIARTRCISRSALLYIIKSVLLFDAFFLALGLVAGKGASFVSARTSYPLSQLSPNAPFYFSAGATGFSFIINLVYISISKWLIREAGAELEDSELRAEAKRRSVVSMTEAQAIQKVTDKRKFKLREVFKLGDVVWAYVRIMLLQRGRNHDHLWQIHCLERSLRLYMAPLHTSCPVGRVTRCEFRRTEAASV